MTKKKSFPYIHGFSDDEQARLRSQARFAEPLIYKEIDFFHQNKILEVGCGVGAQSEILLRRFPDINLTGIDLNQKQLKTAQEFLSSLPHAKDRVQIEEMDAQSMKFKSNTFDGAFICFVLEHIPHPQNVLAEVRRVCKPGATLYITEVQNSSFFLEPYSPNLWKYWMEFNNFQYDQAGDPFIGAKLGNLLLAQGFRDIKTNVLTWHYDNREPDRRQEIINFWNELLMSASESLIEHKRVTKELVDAAKKELEDVANNPNAVFFYSMIQASAKIY